MYIIECQPGLKQDKIKQCIIFLHDGYGGTLQDVIYVNVSGSMMI